MSISKERREELRQEDSEPTPEEIDALLDMADERDRLREALREHAEDMEKTATDLERDGRFPHTAKECQKAADEMNEVLVTPPPDSEPPAQGGDQRNCPECNGAGIVGEGDHYGLCPRCQAIHQPADEAQDVDDALDIIESELDAAAVMAEMPGHGDAVDYVRSALRARQQDASERGEALAALDTLIAEARKDSPGFPGHISKAAKAEAILRRHLTASGVPYVPEEVRRLVETIRQRAKEEDEQSHSLYGEDCDAAIHRARSAAYEEDADELESALAAAPADGWQQPAWRPIDTYPKDDGRYRNGTRVWLWHEDLGVVWGFMDDLPSGFRCEVYRKHRGEWVRAAYGVKTAKKLHYWMPAAPAMPKPPIAAARRAEVNDGHNT